MSETPPIDLNQKRLEKKKAKEKKDNPPTLAEMFFAVFNSIDRNDARRTLPYFKQRFGVFLASDLTRIPIMISEGGECQIIKLDVVTGAIMDYVQNTIADMPEYLFLEKHAKECARFWLMSVKPVPEPAPFLWAHEEGLTFRRIPLELTPGKYPTWDALLERMTTNREAFCHFIGSLFVPESNRQQYLWLHGEGDDGKGSINRVLQQIFGSAYYSAQPPSPERTGFWSYYALVGKRFVVFPDCNASGFVKGGFWKTLTGEDPVSVEIKGGAMFTYEHRAKFMFHSNMMPHISSQKSDVRRLILCTMAKDGARVEGTSEEFETALWNEAGHFIYGCIYWYREKHPGHGPIKNSAEGDALIAEVISSHEAEYELIMEEGFIVNDQASCSRASLHEELKSRGLDQKRREEWLRWAGIKFGIKVIQKFNCGNPIRVYKGLERKFVPYTGPKQTIY